MNTPIYAINSPIGLSKQGTVKYSGHSGHSSMLPPAYAGRWDDWTPWDTKGEKEAKKEAKAAADAAYQEQLANVTAGTPEVTPISPMLYVVMGLMTVGALYFLAKD